HRAALVVDGVSEHLLRGKGALVEVGRLGAAHDEEGGRNAAANFPRGGLSCSCASHAISPLLATPAIAGRGRARRSGPSHERGSAPRTSWPVFPQGSRRARSAVSHSVARRGAAWMSPWRSRPGPILTKRWGTLGGTTTTQPAETRVSLSPTWKRASPSSTRNV